MSQRADGQLTQRSPGAKRLAAGLALAAALISAVTVSALWQPGASREPNLLPTQTLQRGSTQFNANQPISAPQSSNLEPFPTPTSPDPSQQARVILDEDGRRWSEQTLNLNAYYWMLLTWKKSSVECQIYIAHAGQPTYDEILFSCGETVFDRWIDTPACKANDPTKCSGLYLHYAGRQIEEVTQKVELPKPSLEVTTPDCQPYFPCSRRPSLLFSGIEPLPDFHIRAIHYRIDETDFVCSGDYCQVVMPITQDQGSVIEVWAESTLGDSSPVERVRVRTYQLAGPEVSYQFDLLGEDWEQLAPSCGLEWDRFPPINPSAYIWLERPASYEYLATANQYALLAGNLIWDGQVDASHCPENGLLPNRAANPCGETAAVGLVLSMQNQYDPAIFVAGLDYDIPPKLLKGVLGQESQFWPHSDVADEYGLARLTDQGLDMLLTWNLSFFLSTCRDALRDPVCASGYDSLTDSGQSMLRGAAFAQIGTPQEVGLIAQTLKASCAEVTQLGKNILGKPPGAYFTYKDLWALSLASYHSGSGCVAEAIEAAYDARAELSWPVVAAYLEDSCKSAIIYVDRVFYLAR